MLKQISLRPMEISYLGICHGASNIAAECGRVQGALSLSVLTKATMRADFTNWLYAYLNGVYLNLKQLLNTNFYYWLLLGGLQEGPASHFQVRIKIAFGVIPFNFFFSGWIECLHLVYSFYFLWLLQLVFFAIWIIKMSSCLEKPG